MESASKIKFVDEKILKSYLDLEKGNFQDEQLKKWLDNAFIELQHNIFSGIQIPKKLIPKEYINKYNISNLWKYNLPDGWRLIYTIKKDDIIILSVILDWLSHKHYERKFNY